MLRLFIFGALFCSTAYAQTVDEAFDEIGRRLQAVNDTLETRPVVGVGKVNDLGAVDALSVYRSPNLESPEFSISPDDIQYMQMNASGWVQGIARNDGELDEFYVRQDAIPTGMRERVIAGGKETMVALMSELASLHEALKENPFVEMEGFSIDISVVPSASIDFKMKP